MKIYIAGKITGLENYKERFQEAKNLLKAAGHKVMDPSVLPKGFEHNEYMKICFAMLDICDGVYFLKNWKESKGAKMEHAFALEKNKIIMYQD